VRQPPQVFAANIDNVIIITSVTSPDFNNRVLDRFLAAAESSHLNIIIVLNKIDLDQSDFANEWKKSL
jgi:ribosome biogenesis GTPase / thiamine phosphate phosphatase